MRHVPPQALEFFHVIFGSFSLYPFPFKSIDLSLLAASILPPSYLVTRITTYDQPKLDKRPLNNRNMLLSTQTYMHECAAFELAKQEHKQKKVALYNAGAELSKVTETMSKTANKQIIQRCRLLALPGGM